MNLLIIGPIPPNLGGRTFGGIATHIEGLSNSLSENGHMVQLWYHKLQKEKTYNNIRIIENTLSDYFFSFLISIKILFNWELSYLNFKQRLLLGFQIYRLKKILKHNIYDCVHIHSLHNTSAIAFEYINEQIRPPIIITDHGFWQDPLASKFGTKSYTKLKSVVEQCDRIIYISNYAKLKHDNIDLGQREKLIKIKNPIVVKDKTQHKPHSTNKKVIFFNGLTKSLKIKQLDILLNSIQEDTALSASVKLLVLADDEAHNYVSKNKYNFEIVLYRGMPWEDVKKLYIQSDLFVLPSKSESFGLVYLEALALGLPIIGFNEVFYEFQSNITEYIGEPFNSEKETSAQLAFKIVKALNTPFNYTNVYNTLKKEYDWENNVHFYENVYKEVAK